MSGSEAVEFDVEDVKEACEVNPWGRRDNFSEEIDTDDMADMAARYKTAAEEARNAHQLAERASEVGDEAASVDGATLVDRQSLDESTIEDLGGGGEEMVQATNNILRAMGLATDAEEEVDALLDGGDAGDGVGLVNVISSLSTWAGISYERAASALAEGGGDPDAVLGSWTAPEYIWEDVAYEAVSNGQGAWTVSPALSAAIRATYLDSAVEDAAETYESMGEVITRYRRDLAEVGLELENLGYDTHEGPLGLWHTDRMAEYHGRELEGLLGEENPDSELLEMHTVGLGSLVDDIFQENGSVRDDFDPDSVDMAYAERLLGQLSADSLATLGQLDYETFGDAQSAVSNGINALMNPEATGATAYPVPPGVAEYIDGAADELTSTIPGDESDLRDQVDRFNGFGALMDTAHVPAGDEFTRNLYEGAVSFQEAVEEKNRELLAINVPESRRVVEMPDLENPLVNTGSSGLLGAASLNNETAADLFTDAAEVERVLGANWANSDGAASFTNSATVPPPGTDVPSDNNREAAFNVLKYSAANHDDILGGEITGQGGASVGEADHQSLQSAVVDTMIAHMDRVAREGDNPEDGPSFDGGDFVFDQEHRENLFDLMAKTDEHVNAYFKDEVYQYQRNVAYEALSGEGYTSPQFEHIGQVQSLMYGGEQRVIEAAVDEEEARSRITRATVTAALGGGGIIIPPAGPVFGLASAGFGFANSVFPHEPESQAELDDQKYNEGQYGDWAMRHAMADAAISHAQDNDMDYDGPSLPELDYSDEGTRRGLSEVEEELERMFRIEFTRETKEETDEDPEAESGYERLRDAAQDAFN